MSQASVVAGNTVNQQYHLNSLLFGLVLTLTIQWSEQCSAVM